MGRRAARALRRRGRSSRFGEEYLVLDAFDLKDGEQKLVEQDGHFYDVHTFKNARTGKNLTIYFNVDLPRQWLREHGPGRREATVSPVNM